MREGTDSTSPCADRLVKIAESISGLGVPHIAPWRETAYHLIESPGKRAVAFVGNDVHFTVNKGEALQITQAYGLSQKVKGLIGDRTCTDRFELAMSDVCLLPDERVAALFAAIRDSRRRALR